MGERVKLLLVDDESFLCEQICANIAWESFGIELIGYCDNAMDALEQMIDEMPDILITDIRMPVMSGLELIARAKQMNPALQCVILSGYAEFTLAQAAIEQGVKNYLLKPFSKAELEDTLQKCCGQIQKSRSEKRMELQERTEMVSRLFQEIKSLKETNEKIQPEQLQAVMLSYPDLIMLREAMVLFFTYEDDGSGAVKRWIPEFYHAEGDILRTASEALNAVSSKRETESEPVRKIKSYAQQHFMEESLNLQFIADQIVHLGVKYVGRCFIKETGVKFSEYLLEIRMEKAKQMLKTRDARIEEIAEQVGLGHDVPYFYQLFKRYTGMTPKEYRKFQV
ncbi:MAG TPA: response regulator [Candidatus Eisenbergiella merdavium]|uniref:Stage 0 sporulation protein A homolog n=1 Tax=Candidatus Eisenbergiella merdavium TaxID=2838551 RepID=A0A9D2NB64_9FIRM|nr:response regulator [Candidatus Eisenbergiella merdavium]